MYATQQCPLAAPSIRINYDSGQMIVIPGAVLQRAPCQISIGASTGFLHFAINARATRLASLAAKP
jgi:hypothetical protein